MYCMLPVYQSMVVRFSYKATAVQVWLHSGQQQKDGVCQAALSEYDYVNLQQGYKKAENSPLSKASPVKKA